MSAMGKNGKGEERAGPTVVPAVCASRFADEQLLPGIPNDFTLDHKADEDTQTSLEKIKKRLSSASTSCLMELLKRSEIVSMLLMEEPHCYLTEERWVVKKELTENKLQIRSSGLKCSGHQTRKLENFGLKSN